MSKLNMLIFLNSYSDVRSTNAPDHSGVRWTRELDCLPVADAGQTQPFTLAAGETKALFDTTRTTAQDNTTQYTLTSGPTANSYTLTATGGTLPNFRTPRVTGADATTRVSATLNGPVLTFASNPGTYASFTGIISGMILPVTITANNLGTIGNSVVLAGDGSSTINTLIANWNTANPSNTVTLTSGNGTQIPDAGQHASFSGTIFGTSTAVVITANTLGTIGNSVVLTGNGTSSISTLISNWNTANPSNMITLTSGDGSQIPSGGSRAGYDGAPAGLTTPVILSATNIGAAGNSIELIGDGTSSVNTLIANWNILNPTNTAYLVSGNGTQIPNVSTLMPFSDGLDPALVNLTNGIDQDITLSGGSSATPFNLISGGVVVGDQVVIGNLFSTFNQGTWKVISVTSTSFSVANSVGVSEGPYTLGSSFASQIQIFSAAGVQVNDTLVISSGFSPVTRNSYLINAVTAQSLQFYTNTTLPLEGPITTEIAIYESAKVMVYLEADQNCEITINGTDAGNIEPWIIANSTSPGQYLRKSTIYSMSVTNNSTNAANLVFISVA